MVAISPPIYLSQQRFLRGRVGIPGRRPGSILRKRTVMMDLPKVNVVYKKYRSTDVPQSKSPFATVVRCCMRRCARVSGIRGGSRIYVDDAFGLKAVPEEVPQSSAVVEKPESSQETAESAPDESAPESAPEEPARSETTPEAEHEQAGSDDVRSEISSRFTAAELPLTGDIEIDEEIIKFYRARYRKFKSKQ